MYYTRKLKAANTEVYAVDVIFSDNESERDGIICVKDITKIPDNKVDCFVMMDVLEYIENDRAYINTVVDKIRNNGILVITVPAFQFLYSVHDVKVKQNRRYNRRQLLDVLSNENIQIKECHYFYISLLFIRLISLLRKDNYKGDDVSTWKYSENHILTKIVVWLLNIDFYINKMFAKIHIHIPGLSLAAICRVSKQCTMEEVKYQ